MGQGVDASIGKEDAQPEVSLPFAGTDIKVPDACFE